VFPLIWHTAQSKKLVHSRRTVSNEHAKFSAKIFRHFWDIAIFVLGYFILPHPVHFVRFVWQQQQILADTTNLTPRPTAGCCHLVALIACSQYHCWLWVVQSHRKWYYSKGWCGFLFVFHGNCGRIFSRFWHISNNGVTLKTGLLILQGLWKLRRSIDHIRLPVGPPF